VAARVVLLMAVGFEGVGGGAAVAAAAAPDAPPAAASSSLSSGDTGKAFR